MARKPKRDLTVEEQLARGPLDLPFLMLTMLLLGVGLIMMFSASFATAYYNDGDPLVYIKNQAVYAAAGVVVMFLVSKINYQTFRLLSRTWHRGRYPSAGAGPQSPGSGAQ